MIEIKEKSKNLKIQLTIKLTMKKNIKEIKRLNKNKASQKPDILTTIIHENTGIFADFLAEQLKGKLQFP